METLFLTASDGSRVEITQDMFEDLYVISRIYKISVADLAKTVFDCELVSKPLTS